MEWILSLLIVLAAWSLWLLLGASLWIPALVTLVVAALAGALVLARRARARRASSALERGIALQGAEQIESARPDRRAEILEAQRRFEEGVRALKSSRLGRRRGAAQALYALPWYMLIGPPGAGKTTAIKHSGLDFPAAGPAGGGALKGTGGTRNCDWWFSNDAILLDTAGRYSTEHEDRAEWLAFLHMLRRHRSERPIDGVVVAISIADLLRADDAQIESIGKRLRARVNEVMTELRMVTPVYLVFTKLDLIGGFSEMFGDLRRSERSKAWGATFRLDAPARSTPRALFEAEFDVLVSLAHARALHRLTSERSLEARDRIYRFPIELGAARHALAELVSHLFAANVFQETPVFRGFYLTSGTQEGRPLERALERMAQRMGLDAPARERAQALEPKSYFLRDVFLKAIVPDRAVAGWSEGELRRRAPMRVAVSAAAALLATVIAASGVSTFLKSHAHIQRASAMTERASKDVWTNRPALERLESLDPMLAWLKGAEGATGAGGLMNRDRVLRAKMAAVYGRSLEQSFAAVCKAELERRLLAVTGARYMSERTALKRYLMLGDPEHLEVSWAAEAFTTLWAEHVAVAHKLPATGLRDKLAPHVTHYLELVKRGEIAPVSLDVELVARVRSTLLGVPVSRRHDDFFVNDLVLEKADPRGPEAPENRKYPPITLKAIFSDRPDVLSSLRSWSEVEGPFTDKGRRAVVESFENAGELLKLEEWVVPLSPEEQGDGLLRLLVAAAERYDERYIAQWEGFLSSVSTRSPTSAADAERLYETLTRQEAPYIKLLRTVEDHTMWAKVTTVDPSAARLVNDKLKRLIERKTRGLRLNPDVFSIAGKTSRVPDHFREIVRFGAGEVDPQGRASKTMNDYIDLLSRLKQDLPRIVAAHGERGLEAELEAPRSKAMSLFDASSGHTRALLQPLLIAPLKLDGGAGASPP